MCSNDIFLGVLAVLFPPLPVWVKSGLCSADSLINILLCLLGYLPGLLHAWYIIAKYPDPEDCDHPEHDREHARAGRVSYVYVQPHPHARPQGAVGYGATAWQQQQHGQGYQQQQQQQQQQQHGQGGYQQQQQQQEHHQHQQDGFRDYGEGASGAPPPPYTPVAGDHKIQTRE